MQRYEILKYIKNKIQLFLDIILKQSRKNILVILYGTKGIFICAIEHKRAKEHIFILNDSQEGFNECSAFIKRFKNYAIFLIQDREECSLQYESIPALQAIVRINPVESFIEEHFSLQDIVAYYVYEITCLDEEKWSVSIASSPYEAVLNKMLIHILSHKLNFAGIYFLSLELSNVIDLIQSKSYIDQNTPDESNLSSNITGPYKASRSQELQIFISVTRASGIKFVVKHGFKIISIKNIDYPYDKPMEYAQGIIEQEITDYLILHKNYITALKLKTSLILLVGRYLEGLLIKSNLGVDNICTTSDVSELSFEELNGSDEILCMLCTIDPKFRASNRSVKLATKLDLTNRLIFKPATLLILLLALSSTFFYIKSILSQKKSERLNQEYNMLISKQRDLVPTVHSSLAANLQDLYLVYKILKTEDPTSNPLESIQQALHYASSNPNIEIMNVSWKKPIKDTNYLHAMTGMNNELGVINISLKYSKNDVEFVDALYEISSYVSSLEKLLNNFKIYYIRDSESISKISNNLTIPLSIFIKDRHGSK